VSIHAEEVWIRSDRGYGAAADIAAAVDFDGSLRERVSAACERALECASEVILEETNAPWPALERDRLARAEVTDETVRLWYGDGDSPFLELIPIPLHEVRRPAIARGERPLD
jgi:hypothetical protein